ncbi:MAG: DUF2971 domain-containing protein [Colwellia sp.]|nr:DUF2971 domain-containing protein [Colwellia sp.]
MSTLYKYYPPDTGILVLQNQTIRFSPIVEFNDPFEMRNFSQRSFTNEEFGYELYIQMVEILENNEQLELEKASPLSKADVDPTDLRKLIEHIKNLDKPIEYKHELIIDSAVMIAKKVIRDSPSDFNKKIKRKLSELLGALCVCEVNNSLLMWAHYAKDHTGIVFGLDTNKLPREHYALQKVNYVKDFPSQDLKSTVSCYLGRPNQEEQGSQRIKEWMFTKSKEWEYEKEWRLLSNSSISKDNFLHKYDNQLIKEIYLGCSMPSKQKEHFAKLAREINKDIIIYETVLSETAYELKFDKYKETS